MGERGIFYFNCAERFRWHADIKPDNILWVDGKFKLADPGFAMFIEKEKGVLPQTEFKGGTETYGEHSCYTAQRSDSVGAPECSPNKPRGKVGQTIDTWSLGCLLSIASTWVVLGFQGLMQFEILRVEARADALKKRPKVNSVSTVKVPGSKDAFHDEEKVLDAVTIWHEYVRGQIRKSDTVTPAILDLVDRWMLLRDPEERLSMSKLCDMLSATTRAAEAEGAAIPPPPEIVLRSLQQTDREASNKPLHEALAKLGDRLQAIKSGRKPSSLVPLMKTSHRSFSFPGAGAESSPRQMQMDSTATAFPAVIPEAQESSPLARQSVDPALRTSTMATNYSNNASIQEHIEAQKTQKGVKKLISSLKRPDRELETWLKGRDIVSFLR
jgi:serine/threonine protein kinase